MALFDRRKRKDKSKENQNTLISWRGTYLEEATRRLTRFSRGSVCVDLVTRDDEQCNRIPPGNDNYLITTSIQHFDSCLRMSSPFRFAVLGECHPPHLPPVLTPVFTRSISHCISPSSLIKCVPFLENSPYPATLSLLPKRFATGLDLVVFLFPHSIRRSSSGWFWRVDGHGQAAIAAGNVCGA